MSTRAFPFLCLSPPESLLTILVKYGLTLALVECGEWREPPSQEVMGVLGWARNLTCLRCPLLVKDVVMASRDLVDLLTEIAGDPDPRGEWAVYWPKEEKIMDRYPTLRAARAATSLCYFEALNAAITAPDNQFFIHHWEDGRWVPVKE